MQLSQIRDLHLIYSRTCQGIRNQDFQDNPYIELWLVKTVHILFNSNLNVKSIRKEQNLSTVL